MKHLIFVAGLALTLAYPVVHAEGETKKVCIDVKDKNGKEVKDSKTGKTKQSCKEVKQHKKHEGTKVEGTKPDKK
jgi:hypothetical protein